MKKLILIASIVSLYFFNGCVGPIGCHKGSGNVVQANRAAGYFNHLSFEGSGNLYVSQGPSESIMVETDDNIMPLLKTEIKDSRLRIYSDESICPKVLNVYVTMKDISGFTLSGSGNIVSKTPISSVKANFEIDGSGNINFSAIQAQSIATEISGSGNIRLGGSTGNFDVQINGSGNMECTNLLASSVKAEINGSGDCRVNVKDKLYVSINGSGSIYYKGKPGEIKTDINGSGRVHPMD